VNYVELHLNDYAQATDCLSFLEDCAYFRMIRKYYADESPLPSKVGEVYKLVRARTIAERKAVDVVLHSYFDLCADGWHQKTCDEVIERYRAGEPAREAKHSHENERLQRHRAERASLFSKLRELGIAPRWNAKIGDLRAALESAAARKPATPATAPATQTATAPATPATASHSPFPISHSPLRESRKDTAEPVTRTGGKKANSAQEQGTATEKPWTYLPEGFALTAERRAAAEGIGISPVDVERVFVKFSRFYHSHTGAQARSRDWEEGWQLWCQREIEEHKGKGKRMSAAERWAARKEANDNA
jgi:uncharacterized protein YdaU (DUF1376 family)